MLWPTTVRLDPRYFESLTRHAVPLDERAVAALSHSAMGLDIYAWLAQRLHRVEIGKPTFIPWTLALPAHAQVQAGFRYTIDIVLTQYRAARVELDEHGMTLRNSPPPVKGRIAAIRRV